MLLLLHKFLIFDKDSLYIFVLKTQVLLQILLVERKVFLLYQSIKFKLIEWTIIVELKYSYCNIVFNTDDSKYICLTMTIYHYSCSNNWMIIRINAIEMLMAMFDVWINQTIKNYDTVHGVYRDPIVIAQFPIGNRYDYDVQISRLVSQCTQRSRAHYPQRRGKIFANASTLCENRKRNWRSGWTTYRKSCWTKLHFPYRRTW